MSDALPALHSGLTISVIAPLGGPPSVAASRTATPVCKREARAGGDDGKRSARSFRRSTILFPAATPELWHYSRSCSIEHISVACGGKLILPDSNQCRFERPL